MPGMADPTNDPFTASPESLVQLRESVEDWLGRARDSLLTFLRDEDSCGERIGSFWLDNRHDKPTTSNTGNAKPKRRLHPTCTARAYVALVAADRWLGKDDVAAPDWPAKFATLCSSGTLFDLDPPKEGESKTQGPVDLWSENNHNSLNNFDLAHLGDYILVNNFIKRFYTTNGDFDIVRMFKDGNGWIDKLRDEIKANLKEAIECRNGKICLETPEKKSESSPQKKIESEGGHFFVTLHSLRALEIIDGEMEIDRSFVDVERLVEHAEKFCIVQGFYASRGARHELDITSLVFALVIYCLYGRQIDKDLCIACTDAIATAQLPNGAWPATHPIIRRNNREPWHITSHELALCLTWLYFQPQVPDAARSTLIGVMERYFQRWVIPTFTIVPKNNESGNFSGWFDDHTIARGVVMGWATAIVCHFLGNYSLVLRDHINRRVIESLKIEASAQWFLIEDAAPESKRSLKWSRQMENEIAAGENQARTFSAAWPDLPPLAWRPRWDKTKSRPELASILRDKWNNDRSRQPRNPEKSCGTSISENIAEHVLSPIFLSPGSRPNKEACAGMLLGPPGTGKTRLVNTLAEILEWTRVTVPSSVFFDSGFDMMEARANEVFRRLQYLTSCVIFFDEFEEFFRDRGKEDQNRAKSPTHDRTIAAFTTSAMLPRLQDLHDEGRCLIFLATNHPDKIDRAIKRPGRFDFLLPIGDLKFKRKKDDPPYLWKL